MSGLGELRNEAGCDLVSASAGTVSSMRKRSKKRWSDLSPRSRAAIVALGVAEVVVTSVALQDLVRRPASLVRGSKLLWAPMLFVQPIGSPLYLLAGRRAAMA